MYKTPSAPINAVELRRRAEMRLKADAIVFDRDMAIIFFQGKFFVIYFFTFYYAAAY